MGATWSQEELNPITEKIIGAAFKVSNTLGCGFVEKVYENALLHELQKSGIRADKQYKIQVWYDGIVVGDFIADILVENAILLELKSVRNLENLHIAQCLNYLKATHLPLCLLLNFGTPKVQYKRIICNHR